MIVCFFLEESLFADSFFIITLGLINCVFFVNPDRVFVIAMEELQNILLQELNKITSPLNINIIELRAKKTRSGLNIYAVIDKQGGVTIDDCERVTRVFNDRLGVLKPIEEENYNLQVSSPGLNRVFKDIREYNQFKFRNVKVILKQPLDEHSRNTVIQGKLEGLHQNNVKLDVSGEKINIPLEKISKTKLDG